MHLVVALSPPESLSADDEIVDEDEVMSSDNQDEFDALVNERLWLTRSVRKRC